MSPRGWLQQINRLPSAGGSTGSGRKDGQDGLPGKLFIEGFEDGWRAERQIRAYSMTDPEIRPVSQL